MTEYPEQGQEQPAQHQEAREGLTDPDPAVRAEAAQAARDAGDERPLSQIEGEALAAAQEPRDLTQPDAPLVGDGSSESAQAYADAGIAGAPGTAHPASEPAAEAEAAPAEPAAQPGTEGDPGVSAFGQPAEPPAQEAPGGF